MEEVVALLARNLEADETEAFSRDNGLLTFAADDYGFEFHSSPLQLALPIRPPASSTSNPCGLSVDERAQELRTRRALQ